MISIQPTLSAVKKSGRWEGLLQKDYLRRGYLSWPLDSEMEQQWKDLGKRNPGRRNGKLRGPRISLAILRERKNPGGPA